MNNTITRMLTTIGATAVVFAILGAFGVDLPFWAGILTGFGIGVILGILDLAAKRKNQRRA